MTFSIEVSFGYWPFASHINGNVRRCGDCDLLTVTTNEASHTSGVVIHGPVRTQGKLDKSKVFEDIRTSEAIHTESRLPSSHSPEPRPQKSIHKPRCSLAPFPWRDPCRPSESKRGEGGGGC